MKEGMVVDPFDEPNSPYVVLVNPEGQHCLWPGSADVPAGWTVAHGPGPRDGCMEYVNSHWTDLRPRSLAARLRAS
jgi:MbtH protein